MLRYRDEDYVSRILCFFMLKNM